MLMKAAPDKTQGADPSFSLPVGEMFSIVVYGQLILEQCRLAGLDRAIVNQIFDFMVRDFASFGLEIYDIHVTSDAQREFCKQIMLIKPERDDEEYQKVWKEYVFPLNGQYVMTL